MMIATVMMLAHNSADSVQLNAAGGFIMTVSITLVCALNVFCMYRILREPQPTKYHHAPLDIDTNGE